MCTKLIKMHNHKVYLDYNATTPLAPEVLDVITTVLRDAWGNPSSGHHAGSRLTFIHSDRISDQPPYRYRVLPGILNTQGMEDLGC